MEEEKREKPSKSASSERENENMMAILSYLGILCLIPFLVFKDNDFVQYHAKQGLTLFIAEIATMLVG
jgi:uncharacterized membrane protein